MFGGVGIIGNGNCNKGFGHICRSNGRDGGYGIIGNGSCNIGDNNTLLEISCHYNGRSTSGVIGNSACNAPGACNNNKGTIDDGCCNYYGACNNNVGEIKRGSRPCNP